MNPLWKDFLRQQGGDVLGGVAWNFGDLAAELLAARDGTTLCDLSQFGILRVSGDDAPSFLQNLLSSDVSEVNAQRAQVSSLSSPKGRVLASFLIWRTGADYFLHLPSTLCVAILKRLSMYILRAKVSIEDASSQQICLGLAGEGAERLLQQNFERIPQAVWAAEQSGQSTIIRLGSSRFQINTALEQASMLWQKLAKDSRPVGSPCWDWLAIRAGIPIILPATQEQFVPQMINLELIGGVSFKKGCYPGQEIVARMQYLGKLKRRMVLAHMVSAEPQPGDELYSEDMEGQASGMVVNATPAPGGGYDLLAVAQISDLENKAAVHWKSIRGEALQLLALPYAL